MQDGFVAFPDCSAKKFLARLADQNCHSDAFVPFVDVDVRSLAESESDPN